jgi:hypothetical protein
MGVPAEELQGDRVLVGLAVERVDLEDVSVVLLERSTGTLLGLLAGQPGVPGSDTAGTVLQRARHADVLADPLAVPADLDVGRAATCTGVVRQAGKGRDRIGLVTADLVVVDQDVALRATEEPGAVGVAGSGFARLEDGLTGLGDDAVGEAAREGEQARGVGDDGTVADRAADAAGLDGAGGGGTGDRADAAGDRDAQAADGP